MKCNEQGRYAQTQQKEEWRQKNSKATHFQWPVFHFHLLCKTSFVFFLDLSYRCSFFVLFFQNQTQIYAFMIQSISMLDFFFLQILVSVSIKMCEGENIQCDFSLESFSKLNIKWNVCVKNWRNKRIQLLCVNYIQWESHLILEHHHNYSKGKFSTKKINYGIKRRS